MRGTGDAEKWFYHASYASLTGCSAQKLKLLSVKSVITYTIFSTGNSQVSCLRWGMCMVMALVWSLKWVAKHDVPKETLGNYERCPFDEREVNNRLFTYHDNDKQYSRDSAHTRNVTLVGNFIRCSDMWNMSNLMATANSSTYKQMITRTTQQKTRETKIGNHTKLNSYSLYSPSFREVPWAWRSWTCQSLCRAQRHTVARWDQAVSRSYPSCSRAKIHWEHVRRSARWRRCRWWNAVQYPEESAWKNKHVDPTMSNCHSDNFGVFVTRRTIH